jgi:hypothetical protein
MKFEVHSLPPRGCEVVGSKRGEEAYNAAKDELACAVHTAAEEHMDTFGEWAPEPFADPLLTITAFVGHGSEDWFRPESPHALWPALDGVFEGLKRARLIHATAAVPAVLTSVITDCEIEGLALTISELEPAP